jgi:PhoH-like ATPase
MARKNNKHKTYVLDTNVLLHDCNAIYAFEDNDLVIPMVVLEELDNHKTRQDEVGSNARKISRILDELRTGSGSLHDGVRLVKMASIF